ncbi:MAG: bifunctional phosphoglucose/phosphomannose isomerase [Nitriliruptorales bacterium]|nr:bifunctional phosphoglucose/phosphomannose isomerase [Nitriliruptorales bacterium]
MTDLDDLDLANLDPEGMLATVERSGELWREAVSLSQQLSGDRAARRPTAVLVAGMGGSGIAGDVAALAADRMGTMPVVAVKGYELPRWVGADHLLIAVSYSGNTEETLTLVDAATSRGCRVATVTSGGQLSDRPAAISWMRARIPGGGQPRANLPFLAMPVLGILAACGALPEELWSQADGVARAVEEKARDWGHGAPQSANPAKQVAHALHGTIPVLYGGRGVGALVAQRGKCQINENAGQPAFANEVPERDHNELVGWGGDTSRFAVLELRSPVDEHHQTTRRFEAADDLIGAPRHMHELTGRTWLERFAVGALFVDLVSVYLAFLAGTDPTPVEPIERLKRQISEEATSA